MKTFRDMANDLHEGLGYTVTPQDFAKIEKTWSKEFSDTKDGVTVYRKEMHDVFSYDIKKQKLFVMKQGWQLMNVKRGY